MPTTRSVGKNPKNDNNIPRKRGKGWIIKGARKGGRNEDKKKPGKVPTQSNLLSTYRWGETANTDRENKPWRPPEGRKYPDVYWRWGNSPKKPLRARKCQHRSSKKGLSERSKLPGVAGEKDGPGGRKITHIKKKKQHLQEVIRLERNQSRPVVNGKTTPRQGGGGETDYPMGANWDSGRRTNSGGKKPLVSKRMRTSSTRQKDVLGGGEKGGHKPRICRRGKKSECAARKT